ncbi:ABC transporter ATP-binding protein [Thiohalospira sp.]|uniref:ABC transporter ATP-binding protein n=1 Tax=Thiohalospira sp. TaxID=3080549 RepID=UPI003980BA26
MRLTVSDLRVTFPGAGEPAVAGVDLSLSGGETLCLVGESGSGKSVTALALMGLLPGRARMSAGALTLEHGGGTSELAGLDAEAHRRLRGRRMAMIFQEPMTSLNPVMTVGEQVREVLAIHQPGLSVAEGRARVEAVFEQVRLPEPAQRYDEYPHRLSGGQRQRVMIAMALVAEPDLLIADEPTTALDVTVQAEILALLRDLQARTGMGLLFITHDFGVVAAIADRVAVMRRGAIVESGERQTLLREPNHPYTRALLDALPERRPRPASPAPNPEVALEVRRLAVHFPVRRGVLRRTVGHVRAVDGVDLTVRRGGITALVGESGSGKSTVARAILRLERPTAGSVWWEGEDLARLDGGELRRRRRHLQAVFQDPYSALNPRLSVATMLTEPMAVHGLGRDPADRLARARRLLELVDLPADSLDRYAHAFSGGQRQRLGIARALALEPRFLVCDEITSALDVSVQAGILDLLLRLRAEEGLSLLFITHDLGVVGYLADEVAVMEAGRIAEQGTTEQVLRSPREAYTRRLVDAVPRVD